MENTKYTNIEKIIKENSHLTNKELAKKIGKSISWLKTFKAFMNAENKNKYKDSSNPIYKAIYNIWINDTEAQQKELERDKLKKRIKELEEDIQTLEECIDEVETELRECQKQEKNLKEKFDKLKEKNAYYESHFQEHKEKISKQLKKEYNKKLNQFEKAYRKVIKEMREEKDKYEKWKWNYIDKSNHLDWKKRTYYSIITAEFFIIGYLLFQLFTS